MSDVKTVAVFGESVSVSVSVSAPWNASYLQHGDIAIRFGRPERLQAAAAAVNFDVCGPRTYLRPRVTARHCQTVPCCSECMCMCVVVTGRGGHHNKPRQL